MTAELPTFIDQRTIATRLGVNNRTLRRLIVSRKFPAADLVLSKTCLRWKLETVSAWIEEHARSEAVAR